MQTEAFSFDRIYAPFFRELVNELSAFQISIIRFAVNLCGYKLMNTRGVATKRELNLNRATRWGKGWFQFQRFRIIRFVSSRVVSFSWSVCASIYKFAIAREHPIARELLSARSRSPDWPDKANLPSFPKPQNRSFINSTNLPVHRKIWHSMASMDKRSLIRPDRVQYC